MQRLAGHSNANTTTGYDRRGERAKVAAAEQVVLPSAATPPATGWAGRVQAVLADFVSDTGSEDFQALAADVVDGKVVLELVAADDEVAAGTVTIVGKAVASTVRVHAAAGRAVRVVLEPGAPGPGIVCSPTPRGRP